MNAYIYVCVDADAGTYTKYTIITITKKTALKSALPGVFHKVEV